MLIFRWNSKSILRNSHPSWLEELSSIPGDYVRASSWDSADFADDHAFEFGMKAKKVGDVKVIAELPSIYHCPMPRGWNYDHNSTPMDLSRLNVEVNKAGPGGISKAELVVSPLKCDSLTLANVQGRARNHPR
jgi:hypothetical protein